MNTQINRATVQGLALFERLQPVEIDDVLRTASSRRYPVGDQVFEQGQTADQFFVLLHGRLRVTQVTSEGQQVVIRMVNPGDLFGIAKALRRLDYPGTATAVAESVVLAWPMGMWSEFLDRHPSLAVSAMQTVGGRLLEAQQRLRELSTEEVERRVAHAVLRLANQSGKREENGVRIDFPISKQDIAEMTGTTLHTVSRILTAWEAAGLVEGGRQKLLVRDPHNLMLIGDGLKPGYL
uniref:Putative transcriptional regulator Crp/Fnr family protein n=1 Tax=uncultured bacterium 1062 TaxID=548898 RepID=B8R8X1_9BACT|nr:putative transcriptional regulator Crp/Fnr family protein [uncultured bacterium 1062]